MTRIFFLLFILIAINGCKKEDKLPAPTNTGADVIACRINGKVYIATGKPYGWGGPFNHPGVSYYSNFNGGGDYAINAQNDLMIIIKNYSSGQGGTYILQQADSSNATWDNGGNTPNSYFATSKLQKGVIQITQDRPGVFSGTFSFDCENSAGQVIYIRDGWFDLSQ